MSNREDLLEAALHRMLTAYENTYRCMCGEHYDGHVCAYCHAVKLLEAEEQYSHGSKSPTAIDIYARGGR